MLPEEHEPFRKSLCVKLIIAAASFANPEEGPA